jgi:hypothetical protein
VINHFARWVTDFSLGASEAALVAEKTSKRVPTSAREDTRPGGGMLVIRLEKFQPLDTSLQLCDLDSL